MATKKQKREAALAKREEFMAKVKAEGLEAQRRDREFREAQRAAWVDAAEEEREIDRIVAENPDAFPARG